MSQFLPDIREIKRIYRHLDYRETVINEAGDTCLKTGEYFEVDMLNRMLVDKRHFEIGETFLSVRIATNRWVFDFLTPLQYKTPNL